MGTTDSIFHPDHCQLLLVYFSHLWGWVAIGRFVVVGDINILFIVLDSSVY